MEVERETRIFPIFSWKLIIFDVTREAEGLSQCRSRLEARIEENRKNNQILEGLRDQVFSNRFKPVNFFGLEDIPATAEKRYGGFSAEYFGLAQRSALWRWHGWARQRGRKRTTFSQKEAEESYATKWS